MSLEELNTRPRTIPVSLPNLSFAEGQCGGACSWLLTLRACFAENLYCQLQCFQSPQWAQPAVPLTLVSVSNAINDKCTEGQYNADLRRSEWRSSLILVYVQKEIKIPLIFYFNMEYFCWSLKVVTAISYGRCS